MNAYSKDLRLRVLQAVDHGLPRRRISELFGVSPSTIKRYVRRRRQGEDLEPKPSTGRRRRILATSEQKRALWRQLEENDEATLTEHCELWEGQTGVRVSLATMSRAIRMKLGWTYKKRRWVPPSETNAHTAAWRMETPLEMRVSQARANPCNA
jgi:transposase